MARLWRSIMMPGNMRNRIERHSRRHRRRIESRVPKKVRGAVLDLICHPFPKKLLVLLPVHMTNAKITAEQCRNALARFCPAGGSFQVVVLKGSGSHPRLAEDTAIIGSVLIELGAAQFAAGSG